MTLSSIIRSRRARQEISREDSLPHKIMLRFDRNMVRRGIRSYCGYETRGPLYARMKFDNQTIEITPFGKMRRV